MDHQGKGAALTSDAPFVIGIDLGTTNSALAYADVREPTASGVPPVRVFDVPQIVAEGELAPGPTLPSFAYLLPAEERQSGRWDVPWRKRSASVVGAWARDQGALVPGRLVSSAKSWLCNDAVDRHAAILPWGSDDVSDRLSPVSISAAYLAHMRDAWDHARAGGEIGAAHRFERQAITLTVPASFDEEARELTVEAAREARLPDVVLIEEPTAALYAWIAAHRGRLAEHLRDGDRVLICDVGGGTTDFALVSVRIEDGEPRFERTAVGEHLLLGGDNLDLAVARLVEEKLGRPRLTLRQQLSLRRQAAIAKERLLGPPPTDHTPIAVGGSGRSVIGGTLHADVTRADVLNLLLDGFLPECPADAEPSTERRAGLREIGLPFAADPAITRHLAAFLRGAGGGQPLRPDAVLFNGGFFTPPEARERVAAVIGTWFCGRPADWRPRVLANAAPATAVAEGAAYAGLVRRGLGVRIGGGSARTYYVGVDGDTAGIRRRAMSVLRKGTNEGTSLNIAGREFTVATNRPLSFTLLSSSTRREPAGEIVELDPGEAHKHAPLVTELRFGKRSRAADVRVRLEVAYTEVGTLELWLAAAETGHRWRLQFQLRRPARIGGEDAGNAEATAAVVDPGALDVALEAIRTVFGEAIAGPSLTKEPLMPENLMARLEETFGYAKHAWPLAVVRPMADALLDQVAGRQRSARHEARWLNLLGYCLRPGFGATLDDFRMTRARRLYLAGLAFPNDVQAQAEWLVLWQRVAGGLTPGQQQEVYDRHAALLGIAGRRPRRLAPQLEREGVRLLASLEHVTVSRRVVLGDEIVSRLRREPGNASLWWALGRVGARVPFHGPLNTVVPPDRAQTWLEGVLDRAHGDDTAAAVVEIAARTGDPSRDLDDEFCRAVHQRLAAAGIEPARLVRLREVQRQSESDRVRAYGETLPEGLRLVSVEPQVERMTEG